MNVQRGLITLESGETSKEIILDTPVLVGKSFVISSARGSPRPYHTLAKVELTTISDGNWTKVQATRSRHDNGNCYVEWQVISGSMFTVQTGEVSFSDGQDTKTVSISEVDLGRAFVVLSSSTNGVSVYRCFVRGRFTFSTQLEFYCYYPSTTSYPITRWYVIEWTGATVQSGLLSVSDTVGTADIEAVDLSKSFLSFTYTSTASGDSGNTFIRGIFLSTTQLEFRRQRNTWQTYISYFVVRHPGIFVQSGLLSVPNLSEIVVLDSAIDTSKAFMPTPHIGNGYVDRAEVSANTLDEGFSTHKLWQDGDSSKVTIERTDTIYTLHASWFVVEYESDVVGPFPTFFRT